MKLLNFLVFPSERSPPNSIRETELTSLAQKWVHSASRARRQLHKSASQHRANLHGHRHAGRLKTNTKKKGGEERAGTEREESREEERERGRRKENRKRKEERKRKKAGADPFVTNPPDYFPYLPLR